jgi:hypothetical protein
MQTNDFINGCFELLSAAFSSINIFYLVRDKTIKGVSWIPVFFFTIWGAWNLYYYASLNQIISFVAGISIFIVNIIWLALLFYYKTKYKK